MADLLEEERAGVGLVLLGEGDELGDAPVDAARRRGRSSLHLRVLERRDLDVQLMRQLCVVCRVSCCQCVR